MPFPMELSTHSACKQFNSHIAVLQLHQLLIPAENENLSHTPLLFILHRYSKTLRGILLCGVVILNLANRYKRYIIGYDGYKGY